MSGRAHRQKFGQAFDNPEQDRQQKIVHSLIRSDSVSDL
jgi:hypothetical protein